jgi:hypothetical protein
MNSWQLIGQQNLRNDPARCDENVLLVHNVGTFLCINPPMHMQKLHKNYTKIITNMHVKVCTSNSKQKNNNNKSKHDARPAAARAETHVPFACAN